MKTIKEDSSKCIVTKSGQIIKPINNEDILKHLLPENGKNVLLEDVKTGETFELTPEEFIIEFGLDELYEGSPLKYLDYV